MKINNSIELKHELFEYSKHTLDSEYIFSRIYSMLHYRNKFDYNMFIDMNGNDILKCTK